MVNGAVLNFRTCKHTNPGFIHSLAANAPEPSDACRKVNFGHSDFDELVGSEQDSDEDEVSLGTKSSFTSVPLKSVCVKVCSAGDLLVPPCASYYHSSNRSVLTLVSFEVR